jgi:hypothetical protein
MRNASVALAANVTKQPRVAGLARWLMARALGGVELVAGTAVGACVLISPLQDGSISSSSTSPHLYPHTPLPIPIHKTLSPLISNRSPKQN